MPFVNSLYLHMFGFFSYWKRMFAPFIGSGEVAEMYASFSWLRMVMIITKIDPSKKDVKKAHAWDHF